MLLGTLPASILGNALLSKGRSRSNESRSKCLMPPHPSTNFEIQEYYQNKPKFIGVYSRNNLSKIKDGAYKINLDDNESIGTH